MLVATAYMEEAERFDWLVAMNAGKVLATGSAEGCDSKRKAPRWKKHLLICYRKRNARRIRR